MWLRTRRTMTLRIAVCVSLALVASHALAADRIRIAVQKTGTLAWELEIVRAHGLDRKANLAIDSTELPSGRR
jgi:NitT/TauT family transport system substrate-binding protein